MSEERARFTSYGALRLQDHLFRGRVSELNQLKNACLNERNFFLLVYGGPQDGKTSLLLRLEASLSNHQADGVHVCQVDFIAMPSFSSDQVYSHLVRRIANSLPGAPQPPGVLDALSLVDFLEQNLADDKIKRFVLLLDELGTLPYTTRVDLAYVVHTLHNRGRQNTALSKTQCVLAGGIELYNLAEVEASALRRVCEIVRVGDLDEPEAIALIADGLEANGIGTAQAVALGRDVYAWVHGHLYLTQRLGKLLAERLLRSDMLREVLVEEVARKVLGEDDPLLTHLRRSIIEPHLAEGAQRLLTSSNSTGRTDDTMARLEVLGLARYEHSHWVPRNSLLTLALAEWLGFDLPARLKLSESTKSDQQEAPRLEQIIPQRAAVGESSDDLSRLQHRTNELPNDISGFETIQRTAPIAQSSTPRIAPTVTTFTNTRSASPEASDASHHTSSFKRQLRPPAWVPELVHVPAGPFLMGSSDADSQADDNEKPQHRLELPNFWIGKTPVTNAQFRPFVEGDGYTNQAYWTSTGWQWRNEGKVVEPGQWHDERWNGDDLPVVSVSWFEAVAYCCWLRAQTRIPFRLPSKAEWEKAARGSNGQIYPWGNMWQPGRCNSKEASIGRTTQIGMYLDGASPYGALDMAGNVREWTTTIRLKKYPYQLEDEWENAYLDQNISRMTCGGSYSSDQKYVRAACRNDLYPQYRYENIGMRIVRYARRPNS